MKEVTERLTGTTKTETYQHENGDVGPLTRYRYRTTSPAEQTHSWCRDPSMPHLHGFI